MEAIKRTFAELHEAWNVVEGKHDIYMIHLTEEEIEQNQTWINDLQELYNQAANIHSQYVKEQTLHCASSNKWKKRIAKQRLFANRKRRKN